MSNLTIRLCQLNDISHILDIRKNTFLHFAPSAYSPKEVESLIDDIKTSELVEMVDNKKSLYSRRES